MQVPLGYYKEDKNNQHTPHSTALINTTSFYTHSFVKGFVLTVLIPLVPGYYFTAFTIDALGHRVLQVSVKNVLCRLSLVELSLVFEISPLFFVVIPQRFLFHSSSSTLPLLSSPHSLIFVPPYLFPISLPPSSFPSSLPLCIQWIGFVVTACFLAACAGSHDALLDPNFTTDTGGLRTYFTVSKGEVSA